VYFSSRVQAGRMLASQMVEKYRYEDCAVVAIDFGGLMVGAQIAIELHCPINLLLTETINLPSEPDAVGSIAQDGSFMYSGEYSTGELSGLVSEYSSYIEQQKLEKLQKMHRLLGSGGTIRKDLLRGRNIILVSDGLKSGHALDIAVQYLKPISSEAVIVATPLASIPAVDYMHVLADEIYCLSVIDNFMDTEHYYDILDVPDKEKSIDIIENVVLNWR
jgi:putative phosphoribosyl transferase